MGWSFGPPGVAQGIKGKGTGLTSDPLWLLSDLIYKKANKITSRTNTQPEQSVALFILEYLSMVMWYKKVQVILRLIKRENLKVLAVAKHE